MEPISDCSDSCGTGLASTTWNVGCSSWTGWMLTLLMATADKNTDCFPEHLPGLVLQVVLHEAQEKQHPTKLKHLSMLCWVYSAVPALPGAVWLCWVMEEHERGLTQCCIPTSSCSFQRSCRKSTRLKKGNEAFELSIALWKRPHSALPNASLIAVRSSCLVQ